MTDSNVYNILKHVGRCDKCGEKSARGIEMNLVRVSFDPTEPDIVMVVRFCKNCVTKWYRRFQEFEGVAKYKSGAVK